MWQRVDKDFVIIGSGIAGLTLSLLAAQHGSVALITKGELGGGNSRLAQGGIAAVFSDDDGVELHHADTMHAGQGLCDAEVVATIVSKAPDRIKFLQSLGVQFDRNGQGALELGREGAHSRNRIVHVGGDQTGHALIQLLARLVQSNSKIAVYEHTYAADLTVTDGECTGVVGVNSQASKLQFLSRAVILATGGLGQLFKYSTNDLAAIGDGYAMAYRTGATLRDMEFVQFHPTGLKTATQPLPLVSEAVRGEGAVLVNSLGERFMKRYHHLADLATRDVVARSIYWEIQAGRDVFLDARMIAQFERRFPTIYVSCQSLGIDPAHDLIPVVPVAHYTMGGVQTDSYGATSVSRLFAVGEVASSGLHGANRLASNSLLEGIVMAEQTIEKITSLAPLPERYRRLHSPLDEMMQAGISLKLDATLVRTVQEWMWKNVGIVRNQADLTWTKIQLEQALQRTDSGAIADRNLLTSALLVVKAALWRRESRGAHYRLDFPDSSERFHTHSVQEAHDEPVVSEAVLAASIN
ncbi:MAG: L-aspartate oxidase [Alicyclobacillus sp. RIFOXYA1_FULL_53_8]|nr:MAG: L-aspartate oxidase [Alicyclobacillus sp. RIFOXYA1_FULL_53_8]